MPLDSGLDERLGEAIDCRLKLLLGRESIPVLLTHAVCGKGLVRVLGHPDDDVPTAPRIGHSKHGAD